MAYCPQCKEEYENDVKVCGDCGIELVATMEEAKIERMLMVLSSEAEVTKALEYLAYSEIVSASYKDAQNEHGEHVYVIYVNDDEWTKATKVMQGFVMSEKEEPNMEDYYFDEYDTIDLEAETDVSEIKSSYLAFVGLGAIIAVLGILDMVAVIDALPGNMPLIFTVLGVIFIAIGLYTKSGIGAKEEAATNLKDEYERLYQLYIDRYPIEKFEKRHHIHLDDMDEGAKYFALMDMIVKECQGMNLTDNDRMINTIAEKVYQQLDR